MYLSHFLRGHSWRFEIEIVVVFRASCFFAATNAEITSSQGIHHAGKFAAICSRRFSPPLPPLRSNTSAVTTAIATATSRSAASPPAKQNRLRRASACSLRASRNSASTAPTSPAAAAARPGPPPAPCPGTLAAALGGRAPPPSPPLAAPPPPQPPGRTVAPHRNRRRWRGGTSPETARYRRAWTPPVDGNTGGGEQYRLWARGGG